MAVECEAKVLDVDPDQLGSLIIEAGGVLMGTFFQRRYVYDIDPADHNRWVRLRDNGEQVTLAVKEIHHDGIDGTEETEVNVSDLDVTRRLLGKLGYEPKGYQENRRISYQLDGAALEIDTWPHLPSYLEIEADSPEAVRAVAKRLGLVERLTTINTVELYAEHGRTDLSQLAFPAAG